MIKTKLTEADLFLGVANLLPVYGNWYLGWKPGEIFLVYLLELLIIGSFTLLRLILSLLLKKPSFSSTGKTAFQHILLFILQYGCISLVLFFVFLTVGSLITNEIPSFSAFIVHPHYYITKGMLLMITFFIFSHGYENLSRFFIHYEYRVKHAQMFMKETYGLIILLLLPLVLGLALWPLLGAGLLIFMVAVARIVLITKLDRTLLLQRAEKRYYSS